MGEESEILVSSISSRASCTFSSISCCAGGAGRNASRVEVDCLRVFGEDGEDKEEEEAPAQDEDNVEREVVDVETAGMAAAALARVVDASGLTVTDMTAAIEVKVDGWIASWSKSVN